MTKKTQTKALYLCLILMLITGSIFVAVAFGAGKRSRSELPAVSSEMKSTESLPEEDTPRREEAHSESKTESVSVSDSEDVGIEIPEETTPVSVTIEDIAFILPVNGALLVPCSLSVPVYSLTMNDFRTHMGVDIKADLGDAVYACADGVVSSVYDDPMMGKTVVLTHAEGIESVYKGLTMELPDGISEGAAVNSGDMIGTVGDTALIECEEESHLHLELRVNGEAVDPADYMTFTSINEVYED